MRAVEASAKTREEAIQTGLKNLGVEMYEVDKIEILDEGSKGLFGFGARPVKVRLIVENLPPLPSSRKPEQKDERAAEKPRQERPRDERPRDERPARDRAPQPGKPEREARPEREGRPERGGERDRGGRGDRGGPRGGGRPQGDRPQGDRPQGDRPQGDRPPRGERPQGERGERGDRSRDRDRDRGRGGRGGRNDRPRGEGRAQDRPRSDTPRPTRTGDSEYGYDPDHDETLNGGTAYPAQGDAAAQEVNGNAQDNTAAEAPRAPRPPREERPPRAPRPPREERPARPARPLRAERAEGDEEETEGAEVERGPQVEQSQAAEEASFAPLTDAQGAEAEATMREIIEKMGIAANVGFARIDDGGARLNIDSEDGAILIGRKGRTLSALQYLVNRMISRGDTAENTERLIVDVGGYVDRRRESLEDMARSLAEKAKDTGRNMRLKPMSPQERRIVHVTLQDDPDVRTFSLGESLFRSVIISPKNATNDAPARSSRGGRGRGSRGGRGRGGPRRDRFEVDAGQFGD